MPDVAALVVVGLEVVPVGEWALAFVVVVAVVAAAVDVAVVGVVAAVAAVVVGAASVVVVVAVVADWQRFEVNEKVLGTAGLLVAMAFRPHPSAQRFWPLGWRRSWRLWMVPFQHPSFAPDLEPERVLDLESVFVPAEGPFEVAALVVAVLFGSSSA